MAACALEQRLLEIRVARRTRSARAVAAARWAGLLRRRLHDSHEFVDAGSVRVGPRGDNCASSTRARASMKCTAQQWAQIPCVEPTRPWLTSDGGAATPAMVSARSQSN